jgi:hypothetical protein
MKKAHHWTPEENEVLRREWPTTEDTWALAARLGVTYEQMRWQCLRLHVVRRPRWTEKERQVIRDMYGQEPAAAIAAVLGRPVKQVYDAACTMGLAYTRRTTQDHRDHIRRRNAEGATDAEIAIEIDFSRNIVSRIRREMGLASNGDPRLPAMRSRVSVGVQRQLLRLGVKSMSELKKLGYRRFARDSGWPEDLRPRSVQILNLLAQAGTPLSRLQIAGGIGARTEFGKAHAARKLLHSNDPEGGYLAHLTARGLVTTLWHVAKAHGQVKSRSRNLYTLGPLALDIIIKRAQQETHT